MMKNQSRILSSLILTKEGYEVVTAFNGREALEQYEAEQPDIIILDLMLPEI